MANYVDYTGHQYKALKVLRPIHGKQRGRSRCKLWLCKCLLCGRKFEAASTQLSGSSQNRNGPRDSCGCDASEKSARAHRTEESRARQRGKNNPQWKGGWAFSRIERSKTQANKRAKKRGDPGRLTVEFVVALWAKQNGKCYYCGIKMLIGRKASLRKRHSAASGSHRSVEVEHKIPTSKKHGGKNVHRNICLSCHSCNQEKGDRTAKEYLRWRRKNGLRMNPVRK